MKNKILKTLGIILFVLISLYIYLNFDYKSSGRKEARIKIGNATVNVKIADNPYTRERGLSGTQNLNENEGMLFIFDTPNKYEFWMKEMNYPLDILWIDENKNIIYIKNNATPESYPEIFRPNNSALWILEVNSDFIEKNNVSLGEKVEINI